MSKFWKEDFDVITHFVQRLKALKTEKGCTIAELTRFVRISKNTYRRYENGLGLPSGNVLSKFAQFYNVTCEYLLGLSDLRVIPAETAAK